VRELQTQNSQLQLEKQTLESTNVNFNVKVAQLEDEIKKLERKARLGGGGGQANSNVTSNATVDVSLKPKEFAATATAAPAFDPAPVTVPTVAVPVKPAPVSKPLVSEDLFGDLPIGGMDLISKPKPSTEKPKEKEINKEEETKEWEMVSIEYESEVEEPFGQEYQNEPWYLSAEDKEKYKDKFVQADANRDGVVDGMEANRFFVKSGLDRKVLGQIWNVVDTEKKGHLVREQFYAMFHMILKVLKGKLEVPSTLPECLRTEVIQRIGTTVTKRVKKTRSEKKPVNKPKTTNSNINTISATQKSPSLPPLPAEHDMFANEALANDWDNFPMSEMDNEAPAVPSKEKEKEKGTEQQTTATAGEDQDWANFDF